MLWLWDIDGRTIMGRIIYGDDKLDDFLAANDLGHPGGVATLGELPAILADLAPLWWNHHQPSAMVGTIGFKGGFYGDASLGMVDTEELFTTAAVSGAKALSDRLARDHKRREAFGPDHADKLHLDFSFTSRRFTLSTTELEMADGTTKTIRPGTLLIELILDHTPVWTAPEHFGLHRRHGRESRMTTVQAYEMADAVKGGWTQALTETGRMHWGTDRTTGKLSAHVGPRADCQGSACA